ncbi:hypothetical protein [Vibrio ichthyoenteri]|uniref:hypothetical protein n=1 Tax=Vibrio ichthyoenteri TaxID=142461 RepID=UPI0002FD4DB4|nr:hypothetical protein [Vibrio ichthyoenteri]
MRFNINCRAAAARIKRLKLKGFQFDVIGLNHAEGKFFRLVDCEFWQDSLTPKPECLEEIPLLPSLIFVERSRGLCPDVGYLWKVALGLITPDLSKLASENKKAL